MYTIMMHDNSNLEQTFVFILEQGSYRVLAFGRIVM